MAKQSKQQGDIKKLLRSQGQGQDGQSHHGGASAKSPDKQQQGMDISHDIGNIYATLSKISNDLEGLAEIRRTTMSTETKLSSLITRMDDMEKRVEYLETFEKDWQAAPPASKKDIEAIWDRFEEMEHQARRNNIRFVGFPEGVEGGSLVKFVEDIIPELLGIERRPQLEYAYRVNSTKAGDRPRVVLARFLRLSDREFVMNAAREKSKLSWDDNNIMLFPDYTQATLQKREKFKDCKKKLHDNNVRFRLQYPATLKIKTKEGEKTFACHRKAMAFINNME